MMNEPLCVCFILGSADGRPTPHDGRYLVSYDPDTEYGTLALASTADPALAMRAPAAVFLTMRQAVSLAEPIRPDGRPNRPLSGVSLEICRLDAL